MTPPPELNRPKTVLVTGGSGYVAGWCIVRLLERGFRVRATLRILGKEQAVRASLAHAAAHTDQLSFYAADLTSDDGWDAAMQGCDAVLHVASPLGNTGSRDPQALIVPARDGTLRVLKAAMKAGVGRVVMTSSTAAATPHPYTAAPSTEDIWTDPDGPNVNPYRQSKIYAERAAWDYMTAHGSRDKLVTLLPGAIFGPLLAKEGGGSVEIFRRLLAGQPPLLPHIGLNIVDVRDLADLHLAALLTPEAAGARFNVGGQFVWMADVARMLRAGLGERASKVPTRPMPDAVFRLLALAVPALRDMVPLLSRTQRFSSAKAERVLGYKPRPVEETVVDTAKSLL